MKAIAAVFRRQAEFPVGEMKFGSDFGTQASGTLIRKHLAKMFADPYSDARACPTGPGQEDVLVHSSWLCGRRVVAVNEMPFSRIFDDVVRWRGDAVIDFDFFQKEITGPSSTRC